MITDSSPVSTLSMNPLTLDLPSASAAQNTAINPAALYAAVSSPTSVEALSNTSSLGNFASQIISAVATAFTQLIQVLLGKQLSATTTGTTGSGTAAGTSTTSGTTVNSGTAAPSSADPISSFTQALTDAFKTIKKAGGALVNLGKQALKYVSPVLDFVGLGKLGSLSKLGKAISSIF